MSNHAGNPGRRCAGQVILVSCVAFAGMSNLVRGQGPAPMPYYDVERQPLAWIPPGTVIDKGPPKDWTHLILKSQPRLGAGDVNQVGGQVRELGRMLFTAIVANVQKDQINARDRARAQDRYRLGIVATGLGTRVKDQDTIITSQTQAQLGANLGLPARIVLGKAQEKMSHMAQVVRSDTMVVLDGPAVMVRGDRHRPVMLRYAIFVDPLTGKLDTLLWLIDQDSRGAYTGLGSPVEWLAANKTEDCVLHVDANQFTLGIPSENAFAMTRLPKGQKQFTIPEEVRRIAASPRLSKLTAYHLDTKLRQAMKRAVTDQ